MDRFKAALAFLGFAVICMAFYFFVLPIFTQPQPNPFEIPSGVSSCSGGRITVYAYNNGRDPMKGTDIGEAQITGPDGKVYTPRLEETAMAAARTEIVIATYGCGDPPATCPPGIYTIRLGAGGNAATDRVRCG